ncbi:MAG: hypothetical protein C0418_03610 [Coriobacteriaceae bacterium]|nr:hypothetical protein [Coriobacteriaceae bacterium]
MNGATGTPTVPSADPRSRRRRMLVRLGAAVGGLALLAAALGGGLSLARSGRAAGDLDRALDLVAEADETVLAVDAVVQAKIEPDLAEEAGRRAEQLPDAVADLESAASLLAGAGGRLRGDDAQVAAVAAEAVDGRLEMLETAGRLLDANAKAAKALGYAGDGWEFMAEAEKLGDEAVKEYNKLTKDGVTRSHGSNERAAERVKEARALFSQAASAFAEAELGVYVTYADEKLAVVESSVRIDEAWLSGKTEAANAEVKRYNDLDERATTRANWLKAPSTAIAKAYERVTETDADRYYEARNRASKADGRQEELRGGTGGDGMGSVWSGWWWPAATALLGFVYTGLLVAQWAKRRKMHQLMWAVGFLFYAVAAVMEAWSEATQHWDPTVYRVYIVLAASLVGFLGNGTLYLITKKRVWGDVYLGVNLVMLAIFLWGTFNAQLVMEALKPGIVVGGKALGESGTFPRLMSLPFNIPGSLILLGGSAWSIIKFLPKKEFRYRVWANVLIIIGTLIIAGAGSMARLGASAGLYVGEMVASAILLAGFLLAGTLEKGAQAVREQRAAEAGQEAPPTA